MATVVIFAVAALVNWWIVAEDGASPARVLAAVATTAGAVVQAVVFYRQRDAREESE